MAVEVKKEIQLEIAHVLFADIVGYSKLPVNEQRALVEKLNEIVRGTDSFQEAEATGRLIKIPTGDGMALVFYNSPEEPADCALEISRALKNHSQLQLRMGMHSGPVSGVIDVNERANVAGAGINMAQRVMDCGDARHVLLSRHVAEDLEQYPHWKPYLHPLGACEVKHGVRVHVTNLYTDELGNREHPKKFKTAAKQRRIKAALGSMLFLGLMAVIALLFWRQFNAHTIAALIVPEKSIAVLPFTNMSRDPDNAFFTDGVQDEILTDLAKIADLKVISRTSVLAYKTGVARNLREIGQQLGAAHILEGSVQRVGNHIRVNAQLIDARTDAHLWAQIYDRDLADVFAIQSEIARTIAQQLEAKLLPSERAQIEEAPTVNMAAYDLYVRAKALAGDLGYSVSKLPEINQATELLDQAVALDPNFYMAYVRLDYIHESLYGGWDHTPARRAKSDAALQAARRLRPNDGNTHLEIAFHVYHDLDYDKARAELAEARKSLPNNSLVFAATGFVDRRQGRWEDSIRNLRRALELDPRNSYYYGQITSSFLALRRYEEVKEVCNRRLEILPGDANSRVTQAMCDFYGRADSERVDQTIHDILVHDAMAAPILAEKWFLLALARKDLGEADRALTALPAIGVEFHDISLPHPFCEALVARMRGDEAAARESFLRARAGAEAQLKETPGYARAFVILGLCDAGLGRKEEAIREGRRAAEILPVSKNALAGAGIVELLSVIYAWTNEKDLALEQLSVSARTPAGVHYGELKLYPFFDQLRGDPRFEKIVSSLAPK
jgi:TolB-like protein/class 3 adenylate cyclase/Tfp pilus assembly protein PilF